MLRNLLRLFFCTFFALSTVGFDQLQYQRETKYPPQLRWDNIGGKKPYWLTKNNFADKYLELKPGEEAKIRLDRNSMLRINSDEELDPDIFLASVSKGSGLYLSKNLQTSKTGKDLLLVEENFASIVKLKLKSTATKSYKLAFFKSRYEPIAKLAFYKRSIALPGKSVQIANDSEGSEAINLQKMTELEPGVPASFAVTGPARLQITAQYVYGLKDIGEDFVFSMHIDVDDKYYGAAPFIARANKFNAQLNNDIISYPDQYYLNVKEGTHQIKLTTNFAVLAGVYILNNDEQKVADYLAADSVTDIEEQAFNLGKNSYHKAAGAKAYILADNMWDNRKDDAELRATVDKVKEVFTHFINILPSNQTKAMNIHLGAVADQNIADVADEGKIPIISDWQVDSLTKKITSAKFVELKKGEQLDYVLPAFSYNSELKIMVEKGALEKSQKFYLQYDNQKPIELTIYPAPDLDDYAFSPNYGLVGLDILERNRDRKLGTLSSLYSNSYPAARLYAAGVALLPIPPKTSRVKIWASADNQLDLQIALLCRTSLQYKLPNAVVKDQLQLVANFADPKQIFAAALKFFAHDHQYSIKNYENVKGPEFYNYLLKTKIVSEQTAKQQTVFYELYDNWQDILRFLYERHQKFISNVEDVDQHFIKSKDAGKTDIATFNLAQNLMAQKQWAAAAEAWSKIIENSAPQEWSLAHLARVEALKQGGESFLAERSLKALVVNAKEALIKKAAYNKLFEYYQQRDYHYGIEGLIATAVIGSEELSDKLLKDLTETLLEDQSANEALLLALLTPTLKPSDKLVFTALKNAEARTGNRIGEAEEPREQKYFWQGQLLQQQGSYLSAKEEFQKAGEKGAIWAAYLDKALLIEQKLFATNTKNKQTAIEEWQTWYLNYPGPKIWQDANYLVDKFFASALIYSSTSGSYAEGFIVNDSNSISMKAVGPAKIRLKIRPLFVDDKNLLNIKSWVIVEIDGKKHHVKIENHRSESVLKIVGYDNYKIGLEQLDDFELLSGLHEIKVYSQNQQTLIKPYIEKPIFNITTLPEINPEALKLPDYYAIAKSTVNKADLTKYSLINHILKGKSYKQAISHEQVSKDLLPLSIVRTPLREDQKITLPANSKQDDYEEQFDQLNQLLFEYEKNVNENGKVLLVKAAKICASYDSEYRISQLCNSFELLSRWSRVLSVDNNPAVITFEDKQKWQPDSTSLDLRKNLITGESKDDLVLSDTSVLVINFTNSEDLTLKIKGELLKLIAKNPGAATLAYQIDEQQLVKVPVGNQASYHQFTMDKGEHSLRLSLFNPDQETFVKLDLQEKSNKSTQWKLVDVPKKKEYFIATKDKPIELKVKAPAWLRVHRLSSQDDSLVQDYFILSGARKITLEATEGDKSFYRIFEKIPAKPKVANLQAEPKVNYQILKDLPLNVAPAREADLLTIKDELPLQAQEDGTLSIGTRFAQSSASDVVSAKKNNGNRLEEGVVHFAEQSASFRYYDEINRMYFKGDLLAREFTHTAPSYGLQARVDFAAMTLPVTFFLESKLFRQRFNHYHNQSVTGEFGMQNTLYFSRNLYHFAEISVLGRNINFHKNKQKSHKLPDPDVYSYYNKIHNKAVNIAYTLNYEPGLTTRLFAGLNYRTDKKFNKADAASCKIGLSQFLEPATINIEYSNKRYFKGDHRVHGFNRNYIGGSLNLEHWLQQNNHRLETNFVIGRVFYTNIVKDNSGLGLLKSNWLGSIGVVYHFGNGRDYRDFSQREINFKQLKMKNIPSKNELGG